VNSPSSVVLGGDPAVLDVLADSYRARDVRVRRIPVDYASHSAQVDALRDEIVAVLDGITPRTAEIPMISAMTGQWLDGPATGARYWYDSLRSPVEFHRAIEALAGAGYRACVEVSPHPVLTAAIRATSRLASQSPSPVGGS